MIRLAERASLEAVARAGVHLLAPLHSEAPSGVIAVGVAPCALGADLLDSRHIGLRVLLNHLLHRLHVRLDVLRAREPAEVRPLGGVGTFGAHFNALGARSLAFGAVRMMFRPVAALAAVARFGKRRCRRRSSKQK